MNTVGSFFTFGLIFIVVVHGFIKKVSLFDSFTEGAKDGLISTFRIAPTVIALITVISIFNASGALEVLLYFVEPFCNILNIPRDVLPLILTKPLSGSASLAILSSIFEKFGPDSFMGRVSSIIMGATDTTFYVLTVYLVSSKFKLGKKILVVAVMLNIFSCLISILLAKVIKF